MKRNEDWYALFYSLPAYRFGMTAEELNYIELLIVGWDDDENYANEVEKWRLMGFFGIKRQKKTTPQRITKWGNLFVELVHFLH